MCGFNVIFHYNGRAVEIDDIKKMNQSIAHRGPDASAFKILKNGSLALGHVRLSIIDIEGGAQPLTNQDQGVTIVFNGELYDYKKIREELSQKGYLFKTQSDTEVLLAMYLAYGSSAFEKLNGEFAFVIWDEKKQLLIACRDRLGVKPLFFHKTNESLYISSEVKGIYSLPYVERAWNPNYFTGAFFGSFHSKTHAFKNVYPLEPGHFMTFDENKKVEMSPYWKPSFKVDSTISFEEAKTEVKRLLTLAVERRMVADVKVGSYLSGGLDSTLICGLMAKHSHAFKSFNIAFGKTIYDESHLAKQIAKHFGAQFESLECNNQVLSQNIEKALWHLEMPIVNPNSIAKFLLSGLVRSQGYKVCLTGEGADEVFGGYPYFKQELLWDMEQRADPAVQSKARVLWKEFCKTEKRSEGLLWSRSYSSVAKLPPYLKRPHFHYLRMLDNGPKVEKVLNPDFLGAAQFKNPIENFESTFDLKAFSGLDSFNVSKLFTYHQLSGYIIPTLGDRVEMAHSVECRTPFLDKDLLEFVSTLSPKYLVDIENLQEKFLLKEAFSNLLPEFTKKLHKHPFMSPNWMRLSQTQNGKDFFSHYLSESVVKKVGIFSPKFVSKVKFLWKVLPQFTSLWRQIDTGLGLVASTHALDKSFVNK